ncbi:MAG: hypothetical protein ABFC77_11050 [Thermoguttaceae bacterium]
MNHRHQETIGRVEFRWREHEEEFARRLAESAKEAGRSQPDQARELLKNALTASDVLQQAVESLQQEVAQMNRQLGELVSIKKGIRIVHHDVGQLCDDVAACLADIQRHAGRVNATNTNNWFKKFFRIK